MKNLVALLGVVQLAIEAATGQEFSTGCLNELSAVSAAGTQVSPTACRVLGDYELCVGQLDAGGLRNSAQSQLISFQASLQGCVDRVPGRPRITTRDNGISFDGNSFTFARSRRDTIDIHQLRDTIVGYESQLSAMSAMVTSYERDRSQLMSMMVATTSSQTATIIAEAASEQSVSDVGARVTALESTMSGTGSCIPYVEFVTNGQCVPLSPPCRQTQYEASRPTRTSDRVCRDPTVCTNAQFESAQLEPLYDRVCTDLTVCNSTSFEHVAPTATSDRGCTPAPRRCPSGSLGGNKRTFLSSPLRTEYCFADGSTAGGDGSSRALAGKSCFTIRHGHGVTADGARWVFENDASTPFQVFCDMRNCGGDATNTWSNRSSCGGWTMVMKAARGSNCLNRHQNSAWRSTNTIATTTDRANQCGKGPGYSRSSFTDVMFGSIRSGHTNKNVAFRFPGSPEPSMYRVVSQCNRKADGKLIVPRYGNPSINEFRYAIRGMDWKSGTSSRENGFHFHDTCYRAHDPTTGYSGIYKWGFLGRDSTCCGGRIVGCRSPGGHGGNVVGLSGACGSGGNGDCPRSYGSHDGLYTRCTTAWGFGGGYAGMGSARNQESVTGHWWGHGDDHMQLYETALFVRDTTDMNDQ